ncbi:MAG TPA: 16S rRNA (guanine(527)-N(7))-methyltransferase RsmG [Tetragenococcus sp.]|nr:16S rRNA (guanine(527)-N(7))-methyltransferase RsmG [Tetragenococcus sp.]
MLPEEFQQKLAELQIGLSTTQLAQFNRYYELLIEWNQKINLTAITEKKAVYLKHFYDSISVIAAKDWQLPHTLCDVGSGAGFPSIPLKIIFPEIEITIVDSLNKRIQFLTHLVDELDLENVHLFHDRAEDFAQNKLYRASFDLVTARAVARLNVLSELCLPLVKKGGYFYALKAAKSQTELIEAKTAIALLGGKFLADQQFVLPYLNEKRQLIIIKKTKETPKKYPRKAGIPNKRPLV